MGHIVSNTSDIMVRLLRMRSFQINFVQRRTNLQPLEVSFTHDLPANSSSLFISTQTIRGLGGWRLGFSLSLWMVEKDKNLKL